MTNKDYASVSEVVNYGKGVNIYFTPDHAARGTMIHSLCEAKLNLLTIENEVNFLQQKKRLCKEMEKEAEIAKKVVENVEVSCKIYDLLGYVASTELLLDKVVLDPILMERRLFAKDLGVCGKMDYFGFIKGKELPGIVDFKTSHNTYPEWSTQLAGYWLLCELNGIHPSWAATVRIRRHGKEPIVNEFIANRDEYKKECEKFLEKLNKMRKNND